MRSSKTKVMVLAALLGLSGGLVAGEPEEEEGHTHSHFGQDSFCTDEGHEIYEGPNDGALLCRHAETETIGPQ